MLNLTVMQFLKIVILYILLMLAAVCCYNMKKLLTPAERPPYKCYDVDIDKPYVDDTVSLNQLYSLGVYYPLIAIAIFEYIFYNTIRKSTPDHFAKRKYAVKCCVIITFFLIGLAIERLCKSVVKIKMAILRPNFTTVCEPVPVDLDCYEVTDNWIRDSYNCTSETYPPAVIDDVFSSFPSGYTSLISYSMIFVIFYLYILFIKLQSPKFLWSMAVSITQVACILIMLFVSASRILDFKNHWSDIWVGFIGGASVALIFNYYLKNQMENIEKWVNLVVEGRHYHLNDNVGTE